MSNRIVILGAGESGVGAALLAHAKGHTVFISDYGKIIPHYKSKLETKKITFEEGGHKTDKILKADLVIKSPGIPDSAPIIKKINEHKIPVQSEIEFASTFTDKKIIAITGTNGKTTTTSLVHHIMAHAGYKAALGGNIGKSFAELVIEDSRYDWYILELSSFQLEGCYTFHPTIAILTNITPDHLDRYDYKIENYIAAKFRIAQAMTSNDVFIYRKDDPYPQVEIGENGPEIVAIDHTTQVDVDISRSSLKGPHNQYNLQMAVIAAQYAGAHKAAIEDAVSSFTAAPHRLQFVAEYKGVKYYNDSKATNVEAVYYALQSFSERIIWVAGGVDKGNDYSTIKRLVKDKVAHIIAMGKDNSPLKAAFGDHIPISEAKSIGEAVQSAFKNAQGGNVVLLSPACASFDLFKNYEDRGNQFINEIKKLQKQFAYDA